MISYQIPRTKPVYRPEVPQQRWGLCASEKEPYRTAIGVYGEFPPQSGEELSAE